MITDAHWTPDRITGWRIWAWPRLNHGPLPRLSSITVRGCQWKTEMPPATCDREWSNKALPPHESPAEHCLCGYWSLKPALIKNPQLWYDPMWDVNSVIQVGTIGWVQSWGDIIEHEQGYRASRIKITHLVSLNDEWIERNARLWMGNVALRQHLIEDEGMRYHRRLEDAAKTYRLPIVDIEDTPSDSVLSSGVNG